MVADSGRNGVQAMTRYFKLVEVESLDAILAANPNYKGFWETRQLDDENRPTVVIQGDATGIIIEDGE